MLSPELQAYWGMVARQSNRELVLERRQKQVSVRFVFLFLFLLCFFILGHFIRISRDSFLLDRLEKSKFKTGPLGSTRQLHFAYEPFAILLLPGFCVIPNSDFIVPFLSVML